MTATTQEAAERVAEFLRQHRMRTGADPEVLFSVYTDPEAEMAPLLASDLDALVAAARGSESSHQADHPQDGKPSGYALQRADHLADDR